MNLSLFNVYKWCDLMERKMLEKQKIDEKKNEGGYLTLAILIQNTCNKVF